MTESHNPTKTLHQLDTGIPESAALERYFRGSERQRVAEFLKTPCCEAATEEGKAFLKERADEQLSDAESDSAAGRMRSPETLNETGLPVSTMGSRCAASLSKPFRRPCRPENRQRRLALHKE